MKGDTQVVVLISVGIVCFLIGTGTNIDISFWLHLETVIGAAATVAASFAGAHYAFKLQISDSAKRLREKHRFAVNRALFALAYFWDRQCQYEKEQIGPYIKNKYEWFNYPATLSTFRRGPLIPEEIVWLLSSKHAHFYQEIIRCEDCYVMFVDNVTRHKEIVCWRRVKTEPARRLNNEPGLEAEPARVGCG